LSAPPLCQVTRTLDEWIKCFANFPVETRVLQEFVLEYGFFQNLSAAQEELTKDE
jgi:hypothetical protein